MRILQVHNYYRYGGGEDGVVSAERDLLVEHGHEVFQLTQDNKNVGKFIFLQRFIFQTHKSARGKALAAAAIKAFRPDVMHVHNWFPLFSPSIYDAAFDAGVPVVQTLHNYRIIYPNAYLYDGKNIDTRTINGNAWSTVQDRVYHKSAFATAVMAHMIEFHRKRDTWNRKVDAIISLTPFSSGIFQQFGINQKKLFLKPNFVDDPGARPFLKPPSKPLFLYVGRLSPEKGILNACNAWKDARLNAELHIFGEGEQEHDIRERAKGTIFFHGKKPAEEILKKMKAASFLLFPSEWFEGFPRVIAEAFACGLPVVCTGLGSHGSLVQHGITGFHFNPLDQNNVLECLRHAAALPPDHWIEMSAEARKQYERFYTPEINYAQLTGIYDAVTRREKR